MGLPRVSMTESQRIAENGWIPRCTHVSQTADFWGYVVGQSLLWRRPHGKGKSSGIPRN